MSVDGVTMFKIAVSELKGVEEAKRLVKVLDPMALAFCACWLNAVVKRTIETSGPSGEEMRRVLESYESTAVEQLKLGGL